MPVSVLGNSAQQSFKGNCPSQFSCFGSSSRARGLLATQNLRRANSTCRVADLSSLSFLPSLTNDDYHIGYVLAANSLYASLPAKRRDLSKRPYREPGTYVSSTGMGEEGQAADVVQSKTVYTDNLLNRVLITVLCHALACQMRQEGQAVRVPWLCQYEDFVRVAKCIMGQGRLPTDQEKLTRRALNSAIPGGSGTFRLLLGKSGGTSKFAAELNAMAASKMFGWLIGETEVHLTDVIGPDGQMREQRSVLHIKKCRYLEASGCVSSCLNLCKAPTQAFFTQEAGLPTMLEPDFGTLSCNIVFGQAPAPREADEAFVQPCFAVQCSRLSPDGLPGGHRASTLKAEGKLRIE